MKKKKNISLVLKKRTITELNNSVQSRILGAGSTYAVTQCAPGCGGGGGTTTQTVTHTYRYGHCA